MSTTIVLDFGKAIKEGRPLPGETELEARFRKTANDVRQFYRQLAEAAEAAGVIVTEAGYWASEDNFISTGGFGWTFRGEESSNTFPSEEDALCDAAYHFEIEIEEDAQ